MGNLAAKIDLVLLNQRNELVLCELKYGDAGGWAVPQLYDYYSVLKLDRAAQQRLQSKCPSLSRDFLTSASLYIVIGGHVSRWYVWKRMEWLRNEDKIRFKVFQLLPEDQGAGGQVRNGWRVRLCEPPLPSRHATTTRDER